MTTIDVAPGGVRSVVYPAVLLTKLFQQDGLSLKLDQSLPDSGDVVLSVTPHGGNRLIGAEALDYLSKLGAGHRGFPTESTVNEWTSRSTTFSTTKFKALESALRDLDVHLTLRTYIATYQLNPIDVLVWSALASNHVAQTWIRKNQNNVSRWYEYVDTTNPWIREALGLLHNASAKKKSAATGSAAANYDIEMPEISGPIVTRFPPEPSGYLHIGHAKAALLNEYFARLRDDGRLICRFDDTNPTNENAEFQDSILKDLESMGIVPDQITYSSDSFQVMYDLAIHLIKSGKAFADDSELGKGDEERRKRLPSKRRDMGIEETLSRFSEMSNGSAEGQRWALRARIAYDSSNGTLRDPVIYRCNMVPHHRTGTTFKIYPTYDFCAPILDSLEGVTLALRTNEYRDRNVQYRWIQEALGLRLVPIWDFSRLNLVRTVLSKRKLTRIVNERRVWGWDDPRMPTIRGILRRGEVVPALREFILRQGPSRNVVNMQWDVFWSTNRKHIDPSAPRHTAVTTEGAVLCNVFGIDGVKTENRPKHLKNPGLGQKKVVFGPKIWIEQLDASSFEEGEEITLMNWGNAFAQDIRKDENGAVTAMNVELHLNGDVKRTRKKITWLADSSENIIPVDLVAFDHLITKDKLEKTDEIEDYLAPVTEFRTRAYADCSVANLRDGVILQFERKGFFRLDQAYRGHGTRAVFFEVPTK